LTYPAHVLAVCWLAMWLGLRTGSAARASGLTLLWTMVIPYLLQMMLSLILSFVRPMTAGPGMSNWMFFPILIQLFSGLLYAVGVTLWARHQLLTRLRETRPPPQRSSTSSSSLS
jgi:hypothetical protein